MGTLATSNGAPHHSLNLERETGFEPATPSLEGWCSSQLSYSRKNSFICYLGLVEGGGFEPP